MTAPDRPPGPEGGPIAEAIARVKQLDAMATPGPWVGEPDGGPHRGRVEERSARGIETVAHTYCGAYDGHGARNAELVAYYRTAAPLLAAECARLRRALEDIAGYEVPTFGEVALQVCRDMRDDAFDALKGTR